MFRDHPKATETLNAVFGWPHPKIAKGKLHLHEEEECRRDKVDSTIRIHRYAHIDLTGDLHVGAYTLIDPYVQIFTHDHSHDDLSMPMLVQAREKPEEMIRIYTKKIGRDVWIYHSWILAKCTRIADGVVIGAGAVITKDIVEPYSIWAGNPAKMIRKRGEKT